MKHTERKTKRAINQECNIRIAEEHNGAIRIFAQTCDSAGWDGPEILCFVSVHGYNDALSYAEGLKKGWDCFQTGPKHDAVIDDQCRRAWEAYNAEAEEERGIHVDEANQGV